MNKFNIIAFLIFAFLFVSCILAKEQHTVTSDKTIITPIVDALPTNGKNLVWCASYQAVWKTLQEFIGEDIEFHENDTIVSYLNNFKDIRSSIPCNNLSLNLLFNSDTLVRNSGCKTVKSDLPELNKNGLLNVFCSLESDIVFKYPYKKQKKRSLFFRNEDGSKCHTAFYGIRGKDTRKYKDLRRQVKVLYVKDGHIDYGIRYKEFALDINGNSSDDQVVLAYLPKQNSSLIQLYNRVQKGIGDLKKEGKRFGIQDIDVVLFPEISFNLHEKIDALSGKEIANEIFNGIKIDSEQKIIFNLNNKGVKLKSEASMKTVGVRAVYEFNKPFLLYMKKKNADMPYLLMWVAHLE